MASEPPLWGRKRAILDLRRGVPVALVAACALTAAACGGGSHHKPAAVNTNGSTTSSAAASSTTATPTTVVVAIYPLTGLPAKNAAFLHRPALSIKVDNAPQALPQIGLNNADIVTEEVVEGGLTRFFVTFQSNDAGVVGPIRSARPVDADLLRELNGGILVYSGAAFGEIAPSKAHSNAVLISMDAGNRGFYRDYHRPAPSNVFGSTEGFYQEAYRVAGPHIPAPPQLFQYAAAAPSGLPVGSVSMAFSNSASASWTWNPTTREYARTQNGVLDHMADGSTVTTNNVVILSITLAHTGIFDQAGNEDPLDVIIGSGHVWVMRNGTLVQGTWKRANYAVPMQLIGPDGSAIPLQPGRTWMELLPITAPGQPKFN